MYLEFCREPQLIFEGSPKEAQWLLKQPIPDFLDWRKVLKRALREVSHRDEVLEKFRMEVKSDTKVHVVFQNKEEVNFSNTVLRLVK